MAFIQLKRALTSAPMFGYPNPNGDLFLIIDASNGCIGTMLSQLQDGQGRVIAYFIRSLNRAECRYCVTRKDLLIMVKAIRNFHSYLSGRLAHWIEQL